ncbi:DUF3298 and DUF4163 domain-containing protein [Mariniflexile sp. AS56]|uniref:DUF3298 and DUF4163 domain-containing protein n=1 Tax=Mariniflexile sp. AS56 TaxID=3063957 RepID=UPI0026F249F4|nr:DUF3298 and DUF4163 domain-containing protein [Mariniflexile sp. AS56]MDO7172270.1 DUF3298 and DUF4163 domain-containing protein [Mariniflexile sp. AS56]
MLYRKILLCIGLLSFIYSCNEDLKPSFSDINITTSNNKLVEVNLPKAIGDDSISSKINSEINKTVAAALQIGEQDSATTKTVEESITLFNEEYNAFNTDFPDVSLPWEAQVDGEVMFQSVRVISVSITSYVNTGGAHGITTISFLNFDPSTGKRIQNNEWIQNKEGFKSIAASYLEEAVKEDGVLFESDNFQLPNNIGFNESGVILLYNTYEIAPYSTGIIEFTIPIEKVQAFLAF